MEKIKVLFQQSFLISTAILWAMAVEGIFFHIRGHDIILEWYDPISVILAGFLCALPTVLFWWVDEKTISRSNFIFRLVCHFFLLFAIVALIAYCSGWYHNLKEFLFIAAAYCVIYIFVWWATLWFEKQNEKKINVALKEIQDKE